jgi:hypothetical protein
MMLKPLVESQPYVIHGTKDFVKKIEQVRFDTSDKVWIVGGDIEAYYPSVPTQNAVEIAKQMMDDDPRSVDPKFSSFFEECLDVANHQIVMRFQDEWYVQTDGLAMGMAHSPDLANLYGSHFENSIIPRLPQVLYYGRYIDDVIFIIKAATASEAENIAKSLKIGVCRIAWEPAREYGVFLDVRLWVNKDHIEHKPHRKTGNHLERIPWSSAHPQDVKRGTYIGELTRMATLCSTVALYNEACTEMRELYVRRGYPRDLVNYWHNKYASDVWSRRLGEPRPAKDVQVLRSEFNPIWEYIDIKQVQGAVTEQWKRDNTFFGAIEKTDLPPDIEKPLIVSRKRTHTLGDMVNRMRKQVLNYQSEADEAWARELNPNWTSDILDA